MAKQSEFIQVGKSKIRAKKIQDYQLDPDNPNKHTEEGMALLEKSIGETGLNRSIAVDNNGIVTAGNSVQEIATMLGFESAIEVETDGKTLVVVKNAEHELSNPDSPARRYTLFDNAVARANIRFDGMVLARLKQHANLDAQDILGETEYKRLLAAAGFNFKNPTPPPSTEAGQTEAIPQTDTGAHFGKTPQDLFDGFYNPDMLKQIILMFETAEFIRTVERLTRLLERENLDSNSDAVLFLLDYYEQHENLRGAGDE